MRIAGNSKSDATRLIVSVRAHKTCGTPDRLLVLIYERTGMVTGCTLNDRPVVVKRLNAGESLSNVHILFIGKRESKCVRSLALIAQAQSILTVSESEGALTQGSVVNFVVSERKVRFEISMESAGKNRLKLSSHLLTVAQQVRLRT